MPSQILHTIFGEDVIAGIHGRIAKRFGIVAYKALEKINIAHKKAFVLGCQGPDIFYHSRRRRPVGLEYGSLLHRRGAGIFTAGLLKMSLPDPPPDEDDIRANRREKAINALGVYALGFMTHAILDRRTHPYIVYKSGFVSPARPETHRYALYHVFFERILDVLMLRERRGLKLKAWDQENILAGVCAAPPPGLCDLLAKALVMAFPERAGKDLKLPQRIENTLLDCAQYYRTTCPARTSVKRKPPGNFKPADALQMLSYIYPVKIRNTRGIDFLNMRHMPWFYPMAGAVEDYRSFPEVYTGAVDFAVDSMTPVITAYLETGLFPITEAARAIGNSGLSIVDENGKPCAPTLADPLPLNIVLERQAELRGLKK